MHNIWVSRTSTTTLILKCQIVLAGENRVDDGQFWILRGFLSYWEILGYAKQADWASFHLLFLIICTLLEFPCCAKSCPGVSLLPRSNLFTWGNWGRVILTCKRRRHMLHANDRAQLGADWFFFFLSPCPRQFCCCLTGFPGDLDQHFPIRVSKPKARLGSGGEDGVLVGAGAQPHQQQTHLEPVGLQEELARGHQPGQPRSLFVVLRY